MINRKHEKNSQSAKCRHRHPRRMPFIGKRGELMPDGKRFVSMRVKFVGMLAVTGISVIVAALIAIPLTLQIFRAIYMKPDHVDERLEQYISKFASYVVEENIRSDDTAAVVRWTKRYRSVYLTVFQDDDHNFSAAGGELWQEGDTPDMKPFFDPIISSDGDEGFASDESSQLYAVRFTNGVFSVAVVDYSLSTATDVIILGGILVAIGVFLIVLLVYYHLQTRAIVTLSREVEAVSGGALEADIIADRNDEIGQLAEDVNTMRNTILEKMLEKEQAWQANSDLLTSMTHDIRTPLTALLGYMELLSGDHTNLTEEQKTYIRICTQKAEQIKGLSDKLFLYFWAYNRSESEAGVEAEPYEAGLIMEQLIGDYIPAMEAEGMTICTDLSAIRPTDTVCVRIDCLRRVTDNVFDNIAKYADPHTPVSIYAVSVGGRLTVCFSNAIGKRKDPASGTRIGVKTCVNMMEIMKGRFETRTEGKMFTASLTLPLYEGDPV